MKHGAKASVAEQMRAAFDRGFAEPPAGAAEPSANYLGIRVAGHAYAVALAEIGAVSAGKRLAPLPSSARELLGVAGVRGDIVPVFSLAALLGHGAAEGGRWLMLAAGGKAGFAFDALDGQLDIPLSAIAPASSASGFVQANAVIAGAARPVVSIPALMEHLERRAGQSAAKEQ
jgi:chemotaxis signal transduction protein